VLSRRLDLSLTDYIPVRQRIVAELATLGVLASY
jgi:hypothetical protein